MIEEKVRQLTQTYIDGFGYLYQLNSMFACQGVVATFLSCYSIMSNEERDNALYGLLLIVEDMGTERFEDSKDLNTFLLQKLQERKDGEKTDNQQ